MARARDVARSSRHQMRINVADAMSGVSRWTHSSVAADYRTTVPPQGHHQADLTRSTALSSHSRSVRSLAPKAMRMPNYLVFRTTCTLGVRRDRLTSKDRHIPIP